MKKNRNNSFTSRISTRSYRLGYAKERTLVVQGLGVVACEYFIGHAYCQQKLVENQFWGTRGRKIVADRVQKSTSTCRIGSSARDLVLSQSAARMNIQHIDIYEQSICTPLRISCFVPLFDLSRERIRNGDGIPP